MSASAIAIAKAQAPVLVPIIRRSIVISPNAAAAMSVTFSARGFLTEAAAGDKGTILADSALPFKAMLLASSSTTQ